MKWIELIGVTFQFLSFWFAAPELLGEPALKRFESGLKRFLTALPLTILFFFILVYAFSFAGYGIYTGLKGAEIGLSEDDYFQYMVVLGSAFAIYGVFLIFFKRIRNFITSKVSDPLVERLIHKSQTRQQALVIGAVLFTLGFIIQLILVVVR
ncbi:MAG: hypothetical protein Salg2KO_11000 [Salibacteraceae bacterium]